MHCVVREVHEEFGIVLPPDRISWSRRYLSMTVAGMDSYLFAAPLFEEEIGGIAFGDEGQQWTMMSFEEFIDNPNGVVFLRDRLRDYLSEMLRQPHPNPSPKGERLFHP